ncbi:MAG TPA: hypothetical protein VMY42_24400 [Thermoguttaceae bacterium]|nr:hypothetical protein [Thermoguttaceae bacterium]
MARQTLFRMWVTAIALTLAVGVFSQAALGERLFGGKLFSIDYDTDELVAIDSATGQVRVVGPLGIDIFKDARLAYYDGLLYGLNSVLQEKVELFRIDPSTGAASTPVPVTNDGQGITNAEGLAGLADELVIGFDLHGNETHSDSLGRLNPVDGTISSILSYSAPKDFDALIADETGVGELLSVDSIPLVPARLFRVSRSPQQYTAIGAPFSPHLCNDLAFLKSRLYVLEQETPALIELDPMTGDVLQTIPITRGGAYKGLAAIAEPPTHVAAGRHGDVRAQRLFGVTETHLVTIDPSDPSNVSVVGPHNFPAGVIPFDLAYDPVKDILFGVTTEKAFPHTRRFVRYDRQTGRGTVVAILGDQTTGLFEGIEFVGSRNGLVVGVCPPGSTVARNLYSLDPTGKSEFLVRTSPGIDNDHGVYDSTRDFFYTIDTAGSGPAQLVHINLNNGTHASHGELPSGTMYDLSYSAVLDAIFAVDESNKNIYRSDGATPAAFSTIGVVGGDRVRGLAFVPTSTMDR